MGSQQTKHTKKDTIINYNCKDLYLYRKLDVSDPMNMFDLSQALKLKTTIRYLNLGYNDIGLYDKNMMFLSEALKQNMNLTKLNLDFDSLGSNLEDVMYLSEVLKKM